MDVVFEYFPIHTSLPSFITSSHVLPHMTNGIFLTSSICTLFSLPGMCSLQYFSLYSCHHSCPSLNTPPPRYLTQLVSTKYSANCQQIYPLLCLISFGALNYSLKLSSYFVHVLIFCFPPRQYSFINEEIRLVYHCTSSPVQWLALSRNSKFVNDTTGTLLE